MRINRVRIVGFKKFEEFEIELDPSFNAVVGDNETGKSTLLEAIGLVLGGVYEGRLIQYSLDPYLFNTKIVEDFFAKRRANQDAHPPRAYIEAYFNLPEDDPSAANLMGTNNSRGENCPGLVMALELEDGYSELLTEYAADDMNPTILPVEFFRAVWTSFSGNRVAPRSLPLKVSMIDTSLPRTYRGPNKYVSHLVQNVLSEDQRRMLSLEYKKLRHGFAQEPGVVAINTHLQNQQSPLSERQLTVQMDMSSRSSWDTSITAHLDELPFDCAGKGEQCRMQLRLAIAGAEMSHVLLIEEPENHLSHSNLNALMEELRVNCADRQVIVATHSAYVLNKLGLDSVKLISHSGKSGSLEDLSPDTTDYFKKLPGYDTLRLILSKRSILVEGPSDELVVQRAYMERHERLPIEDGVDVISVGSLAFKRFLEIARLLGVDVAVVTDNDGDVESLQVKYQTYLQAPDESIRICFDDNVEYPSLEDQLLNANSTTVLNAIFGTEYEDPKALIKYMSGRKTDCALKMLETDVPWHAPKYIADAIEG